MAESVQRAHEPADLAVSRPGDRCEVEADRAADAVLGRPPDLAPPIAARFGQPVLQRKCTECDDEQQVRRQPDDADDEEAEQPVAGATKRKVLARAAPGRSPGPRVGRSVVGKATAGGNPLSASDRAFFEPRFGADFSRVRVHADSQAAAAARDAGARAFTYSNHIVFGAGQYASGSPARRNLLAHELAHVVQQTGTAPRIQRWAYGSGAAPHADYGVAPADDRERVDSAMAIVQRIVDDPKKFKRCHDFFEDNCPGGTAASLKTQYDNANMWKDSDDTILGSEVDPDNIAYTDRSYRVGRWAMAATFIHEMIHTCGQGDHDIGDQAKGACGALPNI